MRAKVTVLSVCVCVCASYIVFTARQALEYDNALVFSSALTPGTIDSVPSSFVSLLSDVHMQHGF